MSAHNIIPAKIVDSKRDSEKVHRVPKDQANIAALGIVLLVFAIVIMSAALIFMCLSGSSGQSVLLLGIAPFILVFMLLLLSK
ncbi:MAG: hypothetical protein KDD32_02610 [Bacteroidetes bacterium]|nr:hypothetical protein [Bacteroidota bacterium]